MSTFYEIIARVDEQKPNAFSERVKLGWLTALDGKIAADVFLMGIEEIRALPRQYPEAMDKEPLVGYPHEDLYDAYLEAKLDYANGDYSAYQNCMESYNRLLSEFRIWFANRYDPVQQNKTDYPDYYITAYGLAVQAGYNGTLESWLESLVGPKGDTGKSAYEYAVEAGYTGTEEYFGQHLLKEGKSAYVYALDGGYTGTEEEFAAKLAAEYAPLDHGHDYSEVYAAVGHEHDYSEVYAAVGHEHDYARDYHTHDAAEIDNGTLSSDRLPTVPISKGGTDASDAATARANLEITPSNINAVAKTGDTMTGELAVTSSIAVASATYPFVEFKKTVDGDVIGSHFYDVANRRHVFRDYAADMDDASTRYCESYYFPLAASGLTANKSYSVLTTKSPVTVAQGGTGATTVAAARNALGLGNTSGAVPIANGGTGAATAAAALTNLGALPKAGGTMTGTVTLKGIKLTSGTDYGSSLPSSPAVGQLFFLDADAAEELGY